MPPVPATGIATVVAMKHTGHMLVGPWVAPQARSDYGYPLIFTGRCG